MSLLKSLSFMILIAVAMMSTGCSSVAPSRPEQHSIPKIPEIKRPVVVRPKVKPPKKVVQTKAIVKPYNPSGTDKPAISAAEQKAVREILKADVKQESSVEVDPYASIPESSTVSKSGATSTSSSKSSPAVKSLMMQARADIALGKTRAAMSSLERGLRIEPQNPKLWHMLAKAHFEQSEYQQSISMAKKSIRYSQDDHFIAKNWQLIKIAGEKAGDMTAVKEAINYSKVAP